jgi:hypothetical protein
MHGHMNVKKQAKLFEGLDVWEHCAEKGNICTWMWGSNTRLKKIAY